MQGDSNGFECFFNSQLVQFISKFMNFRNGLVVGQFSARQSVVGQNMSVVGQVIQGPINIVLVELIDKIHNLNFI